MKHYVRAVETPMVRVAERPVAPALPAAHDYFKQLQASFETAVGQAGEKNFYFTIAGETIRLRFAGDALMPALTRALAHLQSPPADDSLSLWCRDSKTCGVPMPPPPWGAKDYGAKGHIHGFYDDDIRTLYQPWTGIFNMLDMNSNNGFFWAASAALLPYWEASFPVRGLLHWWCRARPLQLVHAAAVGTSKSGVLLTGSSGAGKSTAALSCIGTPVGYAGDDYVMVSSDPQPYAYSVYSTAKLERGGVGLLPKLRGAISNPDAPLQEKALIFLNDYYPQALRTSFPLKAILLPRIVGGKQARLRPARAMDALLALAPTTIIRHLEGDSRLALAKMAALARSLPAYWLEMGQNLEQIPEVIFNFLETPHA